MKSGCIFTITAVCLLLSACDNDEPVTRNEADGKGLFCSTTGNAPFSVSLNSRSVDAPVIVNKDSTVSLSIQEEDWDCTIPSTSRNDVTGEELFWKMSDPLVSIYITDESGNLKIGNVPYNATEGKIYRDWITDKRENLSFTNYPNEVQNVDGRSEFFWNDWSQKGSMPAIANFYGFYPRPGNAPSETFGLYYRPTSIIERTDAEDISRNDWNKLHYSFFAYQDESNLSYHDLMRCIPEQYNDVAQLNRYGNKGKTGNDNIQMHFEHVFSLLNITVNKGTYTGNGIISEISVHGKEVYSTGVLNIGDLKTGEKRISPETGNSRIVRYMNSSLKNHGQASLIMQPCSVSDDEDLILTCVIDNIAYSCPIRPENGEIEAGKRYRINLTLTPGGITMMKLWAGCSVDVYDDNGTIVKTCSAGENEIAVSGNDYKFKVNPENGYNIIRVVANGEPQTVDENGFYSLKTGTIEQENMYYNIVAAPIADWYVTDGLMLHFDGLHNTYSQTSQDPNSTVWSDLSGYGNDGHLKAFDGDGASSGWLTTGGLAFDGSDDIVIYPGKINATEYTMSFLINIKDNPNEGSKFWRLNAEGNHYPAYYLEEDAYPAIYGHGVDSKLGIKDNNGYQWSPVGENVYQLTFVYGRNGQKQIEVYVNEYSQNNFPVTEDAESIAIASLGGRMEDNSRSLKGTYYSFMIYDRALTGDEVAKNVSVNRIRYGSAFK